MRGKQLFVIFHPTEKRLVVVMESQFERYKEFMANKDKPAIILS